MHMYTSSVTYKSHSVTDVPAGAQRHQHLLMFWILLTEQEETERGRQDTAEAG